MIYSQFLWTSLTKIAEQLQDTNNTIHKKGNYAKNKIKYREYTSPIAEHAKAKLTRRKEGCQLCTSGTLSFLIFLRKGPISIAPHGLLQIMATYALHTVLGKSSKFHRLTEFSEDFVV